jgi:cutinase
MRLVNLIYVRIDNVSELHTHRSVREAGARRSWRTAVIAAVLAAGTLLIQPGGISSASADPCPDIEVVFARGTGEPPGLGRVGESFVDSLRPMVGGKSVGTYAVDYPANRDLLASGDGARDASAHVQYMANNCPNTRLVLGGYSQGAAVMDFLAGVPVARVNLGTPLPPELAKKVAAVAVFGNPSNRFAAGPLTASPLFGARAIDLCNAGDPICSDGRNPFAHSNYDAGGLPDQAAGFVAGLV